MNPPKQQAFKFVIHSKIPDGSKDASKEAQDKSGESSSPPNDNSHAPASTSASELSSEPLSNDSGTASLPSSEKQPSLTSAQTSNATAERKRKRSEKESVPMVSKKIHSQLKAWNQKKQELKSLDDDNPEPSNNYFDLDIMACLLCQRKFKSHHELQRHGDLSALHKTNLDDPESVKKAQSRMQRVKKPADQTDTATAEEMAGYRNRAAERRQVYGQPEKPILPPSGPKTIRKQPVAESNSPAASPYKPMTNDNVGARMLQQMGWRRGEGLGKDGSGIVDPIVAERYAHHAGLGSTDAKWRPSEAEPYKDYAKSVSRKRFQELQDTSTQPNDE